MAYEPERPSAVKADFAGGLSSMNLYGKEQEDLQRIQDQTEKGMHELEHRYDNPNWFKVAAGFAKPQLGGFLASLGSASEAMGENVELQRENVAPVQEMKMKFELAKTAVANNQKAVDEYKKWEATGLPMTAAVASRIKALAPGSAVDQSAQGNLDIAKKGVDLAATAADASAKNVTSVGLAAANKVAQRALSGDDPEVFKQKSGDAHNKLDAARPPQIDPTTWGGMNLVEKAAAVSQYGQAQQSLGLTKEGEFRTKHDKSTEALPLLSTIRDLALGKGLSDATIKDEKGNLIKVNGQQQMQRLLGVFGGNNPIEIIGKAVSEGKLNEMFRGLDDRVRQGMMTPETRAKFEELAKLLAANQVQLRSSTVNPTDAYSQLQQSSQPGIGNSQQALVGIVDLMAHGERNNINNYKYLINSGVDARHLASNEEFHNKQGAYSKEHNQIARDKIPYDTPHYYTNRAKPDAQPAAQPSSVSSQVAPATAPPPQDDIRKRTGYDPNKVADNLKKLQPTPGRLNRVVGKNGNWVERDTKGNWVDTGEKP